ncbi:hypothetical protein [Oxalobacter formigenes]|nr:hypothetical protein [Oxalobacter formigenes]
MGGSYGYSAFPVTSSVNAYRDWFQGNAKAGAQGVTNIRLTFY